jgi:hypothetical protein
LSKKIEIFEEFKVPKKWEEIRRSQMDVAFMSRALGQIMWQAEAVWRAKQI